MTQGRKAGMLPYGNGCRLYSDCFTCPGPAKCVAHYGANRNEQNKIVVKWKPYFERELGRIGGRG